MLVCFSPEVSARIVHLSAFFAICQISWQETRQSERPTGVKRHKTPPSARSQGARAAHLPGISATRFAEWRKAPPSARSLQPVPAPGGTKHRQVHAPMSQRRPETSGERSLQSHERSLSAVLCQIGFLVARIPAKCTLPRAFLVGNPAKCTLLEDLDGALSGDFCHEICGMAQNPIKCALPPACPRAGRRKTPPSARKPEDGRRKTPPSARQGLQLSKRNAFCSD